MYALIVLMLGYRLAASCIRRVLCQTTHWEGMGTDILRCTPDWDPPSSKTRARLAPARDDEYLDQNVS